MENWLVVYDISSDRCRTRLAKLLEDHGDRVQHSAFEVMLPAGGIDDLQQRIRSVVKPEQDDSVRFYPICASCAPKARHMGKAQPFFSSPDFVIV